MHNDWSYRFPGGISLRPIRPEDVQFLFEVDASTRHDQLAALDWSDAQREAFLRRQFRAQQQSYMRRFPTADFAIIVWHGRAIGRLYIERAADEIRGIDIGLLPEYRQTGIGSAIPLPSDPALRRDAS